MSLLPSLNHLIIRFHEQVPTRVRLLIVTLYGDAIEPHGGTVWLGSLVKLLEPLGINERLIRSSVFRLAKEGWLTSEKVGRRSDYGLTTTGRRRLAQAFKWVYSAALPDWDGCWCLVIISRLPASKRRELRKALAWQRFGTLTTGVLACPRSDPADISAALMDMGLQDQTIVFETTQQHPLVSNVLCNQARESWDIVRLGDHYREFIQLFRPLWKAMRAQEGLAPCDCFIARILLINEYRKLVLQDPHLPDELLPADWEGRSARQLCCNLYRLIYAPAEQWLSHTADGPLPNASELLYKRFGSLV